MINFYSDYDFFQQNCEFLNLIVLKISSPNFKKINIFFSSYCNYTFLIWTTNLLIVDYYLQIVYDQNCF